MAKILIVEDEKSINELINRNLALVGHECDQVYDGKSALDRTSNKRYDLVILDVMLPQSSGFEIIHHFKDIPVIFVTAKDELSYKLKGLTLGAEDYIVKPFEMLELIARVNVVLRRSKKELKEFVLGEIRVDLNKRYVERNDIEIEMTPQEYELLVVMIRNQNIALSREKLLELAWGYDYEGDTRTVDVHIQKLRKKLGWEQFIKTINKLGYRLES